ncbi:hypothetical protein ACC817_35275 [Rhizobium ruizarguesonis]|uniref:hypothetical protein n=1 Tax=Rhizobium ruizarguesonis TaxID=2081791 RepID=UPI00102FE899|nr:hypothetical protein [Rhizobium ruizarguesonis]TAY73071.1 hypothetical protein ELH84_03775 [Rhizobium ruizarguesonis]
MSVEKRTAPEATLRALTNVMEDIFQSPSDARGGAVTSFVIYEPIPLYTLDLQQAAGAEALKQAKQIAWRYILHSGSERLFADIDSEEGDNSSDSDLFSGLTEGPVAEALEKQLIEVDFEEDSPDKNWELRIIEIPSINVGAIWLLGQTAQTPTKFYSYLGTADFSGQTSESDFISVVNNRAVERLMEGSNRSLSTP